MFDIGFTEILVIATISLLVIGPERLPETVRAVSMWIGRLKRSLHETRREIEQQIGADDIRRELHNEEVMRNLEKIRGEVNRTLEEKVVPADDDLYPPGHRGHDPNNDINEDASQASLDKPTGDKASADEPAATPPAFKQTDAARKPAQDKSSSEPGNQ